MKCKKCRKTIPDGSKFCNHCGAPISAKKKLYRRPDGLYTKAITYNGKRVQFYGKTEKEVYNKIAAYQEQADKGEMFADVANRWHEEHWNEIAPTTQQGYKAIFDELLEYFKGNYIKQITHKDIAGYMKQLPKTYAYSTCHQRLAVLKLIFRYAVTEDVITDNPCSEISVPKGHKTAKRRAPTEAEILTIKKSIGVVYKSFPVGVLAVFLLYTGLRKGEALALTHKDIDRTSKRISVNKSAYWIGTEGRLKTPKTESGVREIILPDYLLPLLPRGRAKDYVFRTEPCKLLNQNFYLCAWKHWQKQTGLDLTAHQLRHGYATLLHEAGVDVKDAQKLLGHANTNITQNVYTDVSATQILAVEKKINAFIQ